MCGGGEQLEISETDELEIYFLAAPRIALPAAARSSAFCKKSSRQATVGACKGLGRFQMLSSENWCTLD